MKFKFNWSSGFRDFENVDEQTDGHWSDWYSISSS